MDHDNDNQGAQATSCLHSMELCIPTHTWHRKISSRPCPRSTASHLTSLTGPNSTQNNSTYLHSPGPFSGRHDHSRHTQHFSSVHTTLPRIPDKMLLLSFAGKNHQMEVSQDTSEAPRGQLYLHYFTPAQCRFPDRFPDEVITV